MATRRDMIWVDAQGERVLHVLAGDSSLAAIQSQMIALSNADVSSFWEASETVRSPTPNTTTYPSLRVTAILQYRDSTTGSVGRIYIPAPKSSIFLSDGVTIDPAAVAALTSAVEGTLLAGSGNPVDQFTGGQIYANRVNSIASLQPF